MTLDCSNAEALSQIAAEEGWARVAEFRFKEATLVGAVELARTAFHAGSQAREIVKLCVDEHSTASKVTQLVFAMLAGDFHTRRQQAHLFSAPEWELWLVRAIPCLESNDFGLFAQRFQRSLKQAGFGTRLPYALSQALIEMTENVVRHSAPFGVPPAFGLVGYHVVPDEMNYIVADLGRGVLGSLRENSKWSNLHTEADALVAASKNGATRLPEHSEGDGFRVAFQAFLDRRGILAMRSGDGLVRLHGNLNGREAEVSNAQHLPGLRVAGYCSLKRLSTEITFSS